MNASLPYAYIASLLLTLSDTLSALKHQSHGTVAVVCVYWCSE